MTAQQPLAPLRILGVQGSVRPAPPMTAWPRPVPGPAWGAPVVAAVMAVALIAWLPSARAHMTADAFHAEQARCRADEQAELARCDAPSAEQRERCQVRAHAAADAARAALAYRRSTRVRNGIRLLTAQAAAAHAVARQACLSANDPVGCDAAAAALQRDALAAAQARRVSGQAATDAARDTRRFDYDDAVARCDARNVDAKAQCLWSAAWQFDQPPPAGSGRAP